MRFCARATERHDTALALVHGAQHAADPRRSSTRRDRHGVHAAWAAGGNTARLGGVQTLIPDDTCHDVMISEP